MIFAPAQNWTGRNLNRTVIQSLNRPASQLVAAIAPPRSIGESRIAPVQKFNRFALTFPN
jgi:hypothetical protein